MKLYLVRHAEAVNQPVAGERPLTEAGRQDAAALAQAMKALALTVPVIWHSGKARAFQTAEILNAAICAEQGLIAHDDLLPMDAIKPIAKLLCNQESDLMIVGHEPFLGELAAKLIVGKRRRKVLDLAKCSVACLQRDDAGDWSVIWVITAELARKLTQPAPVSAAATP